MPGVLKLEGLHFERLFVLHRSSAKGQGRVKFLCKCDCGNLVEILSDQLKSGKTKSCGCLQKERASQSNKTHGLSRTPEYIAWKDMISRCCNENNQYYYNYGGRGIKVCDRWSEVENFIEDMGLRLGKNYELDRIENNGNYEPGNCRWTTRIVNMRNKRTNLVIEFNGESKTASEWSEVTGIACNVIANRISRYGWSVEKALTEPARAYA
jgi:hypothetical protein